MKVRGLRLSVKFTSSNSKLMGLASQKFNLKFLAANLKRKCDWLQDSG